MRGYISVQVLLMAPKLLHNQSEMYVIFQVKDGLSAFGVHQKAEVPLKKKKKGNYKNHQNM